MASDTFDNYKLRIRRYLHEITSSNSFWSEDFINQVFNQAYKVRCADLMMAHEGYFVIRATTPIVAEQELYTWPEGFEHAKKLEIVRDAGDTIPLDRHERHEHRNAGPTQVSGGDTYLPTFRPIGQGFLLEPAANSSEGTLRLEYTGVPPSLSNDGDQLHSDFPVLFDELLVLDSVVACFDAEGLIETGAPRSILRSHQILDAKWERFIDRRVTNRDTVEPGMELYEDA